MKYIAFEGIDGSGKTTVSSMFVDYLRNRRYSVLYTKEPYTQEIDLMIRKHHSNKSLLFLFLADRSIHIDYLKNQYCDFIVSDRSFYSTIAYQGFGANLDINFVTMLNEYIVGQFIPDIVFYLDCNVDVALSRSKKTDAIENNSKDFFNRVRQGYLELAKKYNFFIINAEDELQTIFSNLIEIYERRIK